MCARVRVLCATVTCVLCRQLKTEVLSGMLSFAEYQLQFIGRCEGDGLRFDKSARGTVPHIRCFEEKKEGN